MLQNQRRKLSHSARRLPYLTAVAMSDREAFIIGRELDASNGLLEVESEQRYLTRHVEEYGITLQIDCHQKPISSLIWRQIHITNNSEGK